MEKVRVGILGCGSITQQRHAPEYAANKHAEIAGFYDLSKERTEELVAKYGGKAYDSVEEMLADAHIDAISVCTPNSTHGENTIRALDAGKHVLCEKPMAQSLDESRKMLEAERRSGKKLMLGHNQRMIPTHLKAKELLQHGEIGKPLFYQCSFKHSGPENWSINRSNTTWFFKKSNAQFGVFGDLGSHKLDLIRFLTEKEIKSVFATMMTVDKRYETGELIDLEDNVVCQFQLSDGMPGIMHFSWTNYGQEDNSTVIYGDKGVMKIFGDYADDIVLEMRDGITVKYHVGNISTNENQLKSGVIDEFIAAIVEDRTPIVTGIDGHNTLAVIVTGVASNAGRQWLDVVY